MKRFIEFMKTDFKVKKKTWLLFIVTSLLLMQTAHLHIKKSYQNIEVDLLIQTNKEKYENTLQEKQKRIQESNLFERLKTNLKFSKSTTVELNFIWNEEDKKKYMPSNGKEFSTTTLIDLLHYHGYIKDMDKYTRNTTIIESFIKMMTTITTIMKQTPSIMTEADWKKLQEIQESIANVQNTLDISLKEINEFDFKIIDFLQQTQNIDLNSAEKTAEHAAKELILIIEMLSKTDNLYINIPKNETDDPFIKFQGFLNIYNVTYKLYTSVIERHNQKIEKNDDLNAWITTILSVLLICIAFYKEFMQSLKEKHV